MKTKIDWKKFNNYKIWIVVIALVLAIYFIKPNPFAQGIAIDRVDTGSDASNLGLETGDSIYKVNGFTITKLSDYYNRIREVYPNIKINAYVVTNKKNVTIDVVNDLNVVFDDNLSIERLYNFQSPFETGEKILKINNVTLNSKDDLDKYLDNITPKKRLTIETQKGELLYYSRGEPQIIVKENSKVNIKKGLDLEGGTRILIEPIGNGTQLDDATISQLVSVLDSRLNTYGLKDIRIRATKDWNGKNYIVVELAGATEKEFRTLLGTQGKFEARIGSETIFEGTKTDIPFVCVGNGQCSGVSSVNDGTSARFTFEVKISKAAADRFGAETNKLKSDPENPDYLEKKLDLYIDNRKVDSLNVPVNMRGYKQQSFSVEGYGQGANSKEAQKNAYSNMKTLQSVLLTGSLPVEINIVKVDTLSPEYGVTLINNMVIAGLIALCGVGLVIFLRYRRLRVVIPMIIFDIIEVIMLLGFAALFGWNLDLVAIAGVIAAIGTGVNDQIIINDEFIKGKIENLTNLQRIKRAFFVVFSAFFTISAAMIPLLFAGAGLARGFAFTTLAGMAIGVLITRPAYAYIVGILNEN